MKCALTFAGFQRSKPELSSNQMNSPTSLARLPATSNQKYKPKSSDYTTERNKNKVNKGGGGKYRRKQTAKGLQDRLVEDKDDKTILKSKS